MTTETYAKDQKRSTRGNEVHSIDSPHYADGPQDIAGTEGSNTGSERKRCSGTAFTRTNSAFVSLFISGKLIRQLSKSLESQLAECVSSREKSIARTIKYEKKIVELKEELESLNHLIEQLEEAEHQIEGIKVEESEVSP